MIVTDQIAVSTTAAVPLIQGTAQGKALGAITVTNLTASQTVYVGGATVSTSNGYPLANGTLPAAGSQLGASVTFAPFVGALFAIGSGGTPSVAIAYSYNEG